jgi:hypothetical protein
MGPKKVLKIHWLQEPEYPIIRGEQLLEPGYVWAPYIPVLIPETIIEDSDEFRPRRGLLSRYVRTTVNNRFYGTISVGEIDAT